MQQNVYQMRTCQIFIKSSTGGLKSFRLRYGRNSTFYHLGHGLRNILLHIGTPVSAYQMKMTYHDETLHFEGYRQHQPVFEILKQIQTQYASREREFIFHPNVLLEITINITWPMDTKSQHQMWNKISSWIKKFESETSFDCDHIYRDIMTLEKKDREEKIEAEVWEQKNIHVYFVLWIDHKTQHPKNQKFAT